MNAQTKAAPRPGATNVATQPVSRGAVAPTQQPHGPAPATRFERELAEYEPQIAAALPRHIKPERFRRVVITAINQNPELLQADRRSLFLACVKAATDGLLPDGREGALVIFRTRVKKKTESGQWIETWEQRVQWMPMIQGVLKRARNTGELAATESHVVYANDGFEYVLGDEPRLTHQPYIGPDRGDPVGAYAIAKLKDGWVQREFMTVAEIERVRAVSRSKDSGPWVQWWEEMARKTVTKRLFKWLPTSSDLASLFDNDDTLTDQPDVLSVALTGPNHAAASRPLRSDYISGPAVDATVEGGDAGADDDSAPPETEIISAIGEVVGSTSDPEIWAEKFEAEIAGVAVIKALETLWDNNREAIGGLPDALAERVRAAYAQREAEIAAADSAAAQQQGGTEAEPEPEPEPSPELVAQKEALWKKAQSHDARKPLMDWFTTDPEVAALKKASKPLYDALLADVNARTKSLRK